MHSNFQKNHLTFINCLEVRIHFKRFSIATLTFVFDVSTNVLLIVSKTSEQRGIISSECYIFLRGEKTIDQNSQWLLSGNNKI